MVRRNHRPLPPLAPGSVSRQRWPRSQPWPAVFPLSHPSHPHGLRRLELRAPDPRERASPLDSHALASAGVFRPDRPVIVGASRPPQTRRSSAGQAITFPRQAERFAIPLVNSLHGSPRMAASEIPQPGARTIHPSRADATPPHPTRRHVPCVRRGPHRHAGLLMPYRPRSPRPSPMLAPFRSPRGLRFPWGPVRGTKPPRRDSNERHKRSFCPFESPHLSLVLGSHEAKAGVEGALPPKT